MQFHASTLFLSSGRAPGCGCSKGEPLHLQQIALLRLLRVPDRSCHKSESLQTRGRLVSCQLCSTPQLCDSIAAYVLERILRHLLLRIANVPSTSRLAVDSRQLKTLCSLPVLFDGCSRVKCSSQSSASSRTHTNWQGRFCGKRQRSVRRQVTLLME